MVTRHTPESWKFVVTAVMETMRRRSENSGFGLASSDEEQRRPAWRTIATCSIKSTHCRLIKCSHWSSSAAPLATNPNVMQATDAFARSLKEIASWDWPCKLVLEHCDAMTSSSPKRLLPLENVLEVITDYDISICINWRALPLKGAIQRCR